MPPPCRIRVEFGDGEEEEAEEDGSLTICGGESRGVESRDGVEGDQYT